MKTYFVQNNIGTAKYAVSFNDGVETHKDGSLFFNLAIFHNKKKLNAFTKNLREQGYIEK